MAEHAISDSANHIPARVYNLWIHVKNVFPSFEKVLVPRFHKVWLTPMTEPRDRKESHHGHGRNFHRSRSHDSAHAQDQEKGDHEFKHQSVVRGPAKFIATQSGLNVLIEKLKTAGRFAYDSEFIGELTYFPKLCLIQTATESEIALIDPLAELDLTSFWDL